MTKVSMTRREVQILARLIEGDTNSQIADALGLSLGTVKFYLRNLYRKTMTGNRTGLARWWTRTGQLITNGKTGEPDF